MIPTTVRCNKSIEENLSDLGYTLYETLGKGSYGSVTRAESPEKHQIAIKTCCFDLGVENLIEYEILNNFSHPNVIKSVSLPFLNLENEADLEIAHFLELGTETLETFFLKNHSMETYIRMFSGLFDGLKCLHENGFLHLDIKPVNIILMMNGDAKLADFGISVGMLTKEQIEKGVYLIQSKVTMTYRPLENFYFPNTKTYGGYTDVFSLGMCFLNSLMGENHYHKLNSASYFDPTIWASTFYKTFYKETKKGKIQFHPEKFLPQHIQESGHYTRIVVFLKDCLHINPCKRLKSKNYKAHGLFTNALSTRRVPKEEPQGFSKRISECTSSMEPAMFMFFLQQMNLLSPNTSCRIFFLCWDIFDRTRELFESMTVNDMAVFGCVCFNLALKFYDIPPASNYELIKTMRFNGMITGKNNSHKCVEYEKMIIEILAGNFIRKRFDDYCRCYVDLCCYAKRITFAQRTDTIFQCKSSESFIQEMKNTRRKNAFITEQSRSTLTKYSIEQLLQGI